MNVKKLLFYASTTPKNCHQQLFYNYKSQIQKTHRDTKKKNLVASESECSKKEKFHPYNHLPTEIVDHITPNIDNDIDRQYSAWFYNWCSIRFPTNANYCQPLRKENVASQSVKQPTLVIFHVEIATRTRRRQRHRVNKLSVDMTTLHAIQ